LCGKVQCLRSSLKGGKARLRAGCRLQVTRGSARLLRIGWVVDLSFHNTSSIQSNKRDASWNRSHIDTTPCRRASTFAINLQPRRGDEPLVCSLVAPPLIETHFDATSYVWGSPVRGQVVTCGRRSLKIMSSLHEVLCRLRLQDAPRQLWAGGVCINQDDVKGKGHQAGFFHE
jgi:hypothetical protein